MESTKNYSAIEITIEERVESSSSTDLVDSASLSETRANQDQSTTKNASRYDTTGMTRLQKLFFYTKFLVPLMITLSIDAGIPIALYYILKNFTSQLIALIVSGIPPLLHVIYTFIRRRKVDALGCICLLSFIISAVVSVLTGDVRLALLRDSVTTAVISFIFFITLIPIRTKWFTNRPIIHTFSQQMVQGAPPKEWTNAKGETQSMPYLEWVWEHIPKYRRFAYILTALWSFVLMGEFVARVIMIEATSLSVDQIVLYGNIIVSVAVCSITFVTILYSIHLQKYIKKQEAIWKRENDFTDRLLK